MNDSAHLVLNPQPEGHSVFLAGDWANNGPLTSEEHSRLRRVLVSLVIGATAGALLHMHAPVYAPVLPFVITIGVVATAAKAFRYDDEAHESRGHVPATI